MRLSGQPDSHHATWPGKAETENLAQSGIKQKTTEIITIHKDHKGHEGETDLEQEVTEETEIASYYSSSSFLLCLRSVFVAFVIFVYCDDLPSFLFGFAFVRTFFGWIAKKRGEAELGTGR